MNDKIVKTLETIAQATQAASSEMASLRTVVEELRSAQNSLALAVERTVEELRRRTP